MNHLSDTFESSAQLALTAAEEAHRFGHPDVDVEHLFLALAVSSTPAGRLLREAGVSLDAARSAAESVHAAHLATLGVPDVQVPVRPIPPRGLQEVTWNERALMTFSESGGDLSGVTLLRNLITEPRGIVADMLTHLGAAPGVILDALAERERAERTSDAEAAAPAGGPRRGREVTHECFIPAPVDRAWGLLDDPAQRPLWDATVDSIEQVTEDQWIARMDPAPRGRGKAPERARERAILIRRRDERSRLEWERHFPRMPRKRADLLIVRLGPEGDGTRLQLQLWKPHTLIPTPRFLMQIELTTLAAGISRALRT